jgi:hypothetical protein
MAEFIKDQNMPDGSKCDPGVKFQKTWLIKNSGKLEWCDNKFPVKLVCIAGNILTEDDVDCVDVPETGVEQTASISVALVAPPIEGTYFSEWVLCCHGFKFGPRIWCTIQVRLYFLTLCVIFNIDRVFNFHFQIAKMYFFIKI